MTQQAMAQSDVATSRAKVEAYRGMFEFQTGIFENALDGLSESIALERPSPNANHINWLLGHLVHCRYMLANMIGAEAPNPFGETYWTAIEDRTYPTLIEITSRWSEITQLLLERLTEISDADLMTTPAKNRPPLDGIISFFAYHEAYHLGQIGIIRKIVGLPAMQSH